MTAWENKLQNRWLESLFCFFSAALETICLDSCSTCRCWHRLNKYLHTALMYPSTSRSINIYSWVKCKLLESSTASNNGAIQAQIGQLLCMVFYGDPSVQKATERRAYHSIHYSSSNTVPLWRLWRYRLSTVIQRQVETHTHTVLIHAQAKWIEKLMQLLIYKL